MKNLLQNNKIAAARIKLKETLTFEHVKKLTKYRKLTEQQYEVLVKNLENICVLLISSYLQSKPELYE